jgi:hypothetical protein
VVLVINARRRLVQLASSLSILSTLQPKISGPCCSFFCYEIWLNGTEAEATAMGLMLARLGGRGRLVCCSIVYMHTQARQVLKVSAVSWGG